MQYVFEVENQCNRYGGMFVECQKCKFGVYVVDIVIGSCKFLYGCFGNVGIVVELFNDEDYIEDCIGCVYVGDNEIELGQLFDGCFGYQFEEQCRECNVDDEDVELVKSISWYFFLLGYDIVDQDQFEEWQYKFGNVCYIEVLVCQNLSELVDLFENWKGLLELDCDICDEFGQKCDVGQYQQFVYDFFYSVQMVLEM